MQQDNDILLSEEEYNELYLLGNLGIYEFQTASGSSTDGDASVF